MTLVTRQRTVASTVTCTGVGVHSGISINLTLKPAPANHGIKFIRTDLPDSPAISAIFNRVVDTSLATVIGYEGAIVSTIEHLMAAFAGMAIDNAIVELDGYEMPIMDGSAERFADLIHDAGINEFSVPRSFFSITRELVIEDGGKYVKASPLNDYKLSTIIEFPHPLIQKQVFDFEASKNRFREDICRARTFGFYKEVDTLRRFGLAKGASLETGIAMDDENVINEEGLRFKDEFVRHKLLDCLGDFSLLGMPILGHIETYKSGHAFNHAFLKELMTRKDCWETKQFDSTPSLDAKVPKSLAI